MKVAILLLLIAFIQDVAPSAPDSSGKIIIKDCFTSYVYEINSNGKLFFYEPWDNEMQGKRIHKDTMLNKHDIVQFLSLLDSFFITRDDEIYDNACIADGSTTKFFLEKDNDRKKIFIHYYFDNRINQLKELIDPYLNVQDEIVALNRIRPENEAQKQRKIDSYKNCSEKTSEKMKNHLLNSFCELE